MLNDTTRICCYVIHGAVNAILAGYYGNAMTVLNRNGVAFTSDCCNGARCCSVFIQVMVEV